MADRVTYYALSSGPSSTTGTAYVDAVTLNFTPADGDYLYIASYVHSNDSASNDEMFCQLWDGSAEVDLHHIEQSDPSDTRTGREGRRIRSAKDLSC